LCRTKLSVKQRLISGTLNKSIGVALLRDALQLGVLLVNASINRRMVQGKSDVMEALSLSPSPEERAGLEYAEAAMLSQQIGSGVTQIAD
jgi:hypothetical protein